MYTSGYFYVTKKIGKFGGVEKALKHMQNEISVLVIEDEETWAETITYDLNQFGFNALPCCYTLAEALPAIRANNFDIALLDINLNGANSGIELGMLISQTLNKPFIFITSSVHDGIVEETAAARPSAFLIKPYTPTALFISIQSALHHFHAAPAPVKNLQTAAAESVFIKAGNKYVKVLWQDVVCLRSEKIYTGIVTNDGNTYLIRSSLQKTMQYIIPEALKSRFVQINRAEVLHISYIREVVGTEAMTEQQSFGITDGYMKNLKQQLNIIS